MKQVQRSKKSEHGTSSNRMKCERAREKNECDRVNARGKVLDSYNTNNSIYYKNNPK